VSDALLEICVSSSCDPLVGVAGGDGSLAKWLLPTADGAAFRYDSALARCLDAGTGALRLWVHNRHVKALHMWRDLVRDPRVEVVLFESSGLAEALDVLNLIQAQVVLDAVAIVDGGAGAPVFGEALQRFVRQPDWRIQVFPFAKMIFEALEEVSTAPTNRWGLRPGSYRVRRVGEGEGAETPLVAGLVEEGGQEVADWWRRRPGCRGCERRGFCGGVVSGPEGGCLPGTSDVVEMAFQASVDLRAARDERPVTATS
jgi:hypothetical protein